MPRGWLFENDEDTLENWFVKDYDTDNADIVAIVPKTLDEDYDNEVTYPNVQKIGAAKDMFFALLEVMENGFVQCNCGETCEGTCTHSKMAAALTKAGYRPPEKLKPKRKE